MRSPAGLSALAAPQRSRRVSPGGSPIARRVGTVLGGLAGAIASLAAATAPAIAADEVVFVYGPIRPTIPIADLERLAETGTTGNPLAFYLDFAGVDFATAQQALNAEIALDLAPVDRLLNDLVGEYALYELGRLIYPRSQQASIQALRSAIVLSLADDGKLTPLELLQRYPTRQVYISGPQIARVAREARQFTAGETVSLEATLLEIQAAIAGAVCECEAETDDGEE